MKLIRRNDWNEYVIRAEGRRIPMWLNGQQTVDYIEPDATIPQEGVFGLQIHQGAASETWYKAITIQILDDNSTTDRRLPAGHRHGSVLHVRREVLTGLLAP